MAGIGKAINILAITPIRMLRHRTPYEAGFDNVDSVEPVSDVIKILAFIKQNSNFKSVYICIMQNLLYFL